MEQRLNGILTQAILCSGIVHKYGKIEPKDLKKYLKILINLHRIKPFKK